MPMFDLKDPAGVLLEVNECRSTYPNHYIRVSAFDSSKGWESLRLSFIVNRPAQEPAFRLVRQEIDGRRMRYGVASFAVNTGPENQQH